MNGKTMAAEILAAMGGEDNEIRRKAFEDFCVALVAHIQKNASISGPATGLAMTGPGTAVTGTIIVPPGSIK